MKNQVLKRKEKSLKLLEENVKQCGFSINHNFSTDIAENQSDTGFSASNTKKVPVNHLKAFLKN